MAAIWSQNQADKLAVATVVTATKPSGSLTIQTTLQPGGDPIPRLYSAGELGSPFGMLYPSGGGNFSDCIAFGRIAAEGFCRETPLV